MRRRERGAGRTLRLATCLLVPALVLTLGAGCSGDDSGSSGELLPRVLDPSQVAGADEANAFPVGQEWRHKVSWGSPSAFYRTGFELYQASIETCMKERGFTYDPSPWYDDDILSIVTNPLNRDAALRYGYHLPPYGATNVSDQSGQGEDFLAALNGRGDSSGERGCGDVAYDYAYGGSSNDVADQFDQIANDVSTTISGYDATSEGLGLIAKWSDCMNGRGYDYDAPADPQKEFSDDETLVEKELRVRRADLECDAEVGLTKSRSIYETEKFESWVDLNSEVIRAYEAAISMAETELTARRAALDSAGADALPL